MNDVVDFRELITERFGEFEKSLNGSSPILLKSIRKEALERFSLTKFPTTKDEEWRFTNILPLLKYSFDPIVDKHELNVKDISNFKLKDSFKNHIVFVDGIFSEELSASNSLDKLVIVKNLSIACKEDQELFKKHFSKYAHFQDNAFTALNSAYIKDGAFISVPDNISVEEPILVLFISTAMNNQPLVQPRNLYITGRNSKVTFVEHYISLSSNTYFTNAVTEIVVGENTTLNHIKIQEESSSAFHISRTEIDQERDSNYESVSISLGAEISRDDISSKFNGEGGECTLNGLYLMDNTQLHDTHTMIDHAKPYCNSHEHFKGILDGKSRGVFNGKVMVRPNAQKTNAFQENNNIILSNEALVNTKPQLEIFADDVKCSHGATIGQLDDESMFYLKSRGIGEETARTILIHAFASDVVKSIKIDSIKNYLENILDQRFNKES